jgi:hypothetical protein
MFVLKKKGKCIKKNKNKKKGKCCELKEVAADE